MRTWIVVCDASRARFFMSRGEKQWTLFEEFEHPAGRAKGLDLRSDRPGRQLQTQAPQKRAGMEPHTDPREVEEERFARYITKTLHEAHAQDAFDRLVLVAPSGFLGRLRAHLSHQLEKCLFGTLDRDLTQLPAKELEDRVAIPLAE